MRKLNPAILQAMESVAHAAPAVALDEDRPNCHFVSPAFWLNDPSGTIYHQGWYHAFYQHNPYDDMWGDMHWGHARSQDLVHWEHQPIALWPSREDGERHCFSGCAWVLSDGTPMLFYTSIADKKQRPPQQWAAHGTEDWKIWRKHPQNPVITLDIHDDLEVREWRDPFLFRAGGRTLMLIGGKLNADNGRSPACFIYEAHNPALTSWTYRGIFYRNENSSFSNFECPNFVKLDEKWVLLSSHDGHPVEYVVGDFDPHMLVFKPERRGIIDYNTSDSHFYATNVMRSPEGQCILLGWIRGFKPKRGWNGCFSFPRVLDTNASGELVQKPWAALADLREHREEVCGQLARGTLYVLPKTRGRSIEVVGSVRLKPNAACELNLCCREDGSGGIHVKIEPNIVTLDGVAVELNRPHLASPIAIQVFIDRTVVEVFADNGRRCITRVVYPDDAGPCVSFRGSAHLDLTVWTLSDA